MFDKVDGFFRDNNGTKSLVLLGLQKNDAVYDEDQISQRIKKSYCICFFS